jgi:lipoic acid synthetase
LRTKEAGIRSKTGIMVGLDETREQVIELMQDCADHKVDVLTIGQYMQPTKMHHPVKEWVHPDQFAEYKEIGERLGIEHVESGPLVRSSYHAERHV